MNLRTVKSTRGKRASHYTMSQLFGLGDNKTNMIKKTNLSTYLMLLANKAATSFLVSICIELSIFHNNLFA